MELNINLDSFAKLYNEGDFITGTITAVSNERLVEFSKLNLILIVKNKIKIGSIYN
jgi:hypothetical protein